MDYRRVVDKYKFTYRQRSLTSLKWRRFSGMGALQMRTCDSSKDARIHNLCATGLRYLVSPN
uniref:hypothetical protein n=1 Tax=Paraburkholderia sp. J69-1 TaxID=2805436 RepID=UPI002AB6EB49